MTKQTIEVEGLPEGWRAVSFRPPLKNEKYVFEDEIHTALENMAYSYLIVEKIQPRRIVLDLTQDEHALLLKIPIEQRLFGNPVIFDLLAKIKSAQGNDK